MSPDVNDPGYRAVTFDDLRIAYKQQVGHYGWRLRFTFVETILIP
jgi:hypothetical protein